MLDTSLYECGKCSFKPAPHPRFNKGNTMTTENKEVRKLTDREIFEVQHQLSEVRPKLLNLGEQMRLLREWEYELRKMVADGEATSEILTELSNKEAA